MKLYPLREKKVKRPRFREYGQSDKPCFNIDNGVAYAVSGGRWLIAFNGEFMGDFGSGVNQNGRSNSSRGFVAFTHSKLGRLEAEQDIINLLDYNAKLDFRTVRDSSFMDYHSSVGYESDLIVQLKNFSIKNPQRKLKKDLVDYK